MVSLFTSGNVLAEKRIALPPGRICGSARAIPRPRGSLVRAGPFEGVDLCWSANGGLIQPHF